MQNQDSEILKASAKYYHRLPLGHHDPVNNNPSDCYLTAVPSGHRGQFNYFIESPYVFPVRVRQLSQSDINKKFNLNLIWE